MRAALINLIVLLAATGCASTKVHPHPDACDKGFRFYRPKPYLFIQPAAQAPEHQTCDLTYVEMKLEWLPDFNEQYSIRVRAGAGDNKTKIILDQGWNLTQIDFALDSKTDDNIKAVTELGTAIASKFGLPSVSTASQADAHATTVLAKEVPLGFYEAVIDRDANGTKRLYGWRYLGFMPYNTCPTDGSGGQCHDCATSDVYGLVFDHTVKALVFKCLNNMHRETFATVCPPPPPPPPPTPCPDPKPTKKSELIGQPNKSEGK